MQNLLSQSSWSLCSNLFLKLSTCPLSSRRAKDGAAYRASCCSRSCRSKAATRLSRAHSTSASITLDEAGCAPTIFKRPEAQLTPTFCTPSNRVHRVYFVLKKGGIKSDLCETSLFNPKGVRCRFTLIGQLLFGGVSAIASRLFNHLFPIFWIL